MAQYYINSASAGGDGTTQALSGANAAWAAISEITGEGAGDIISLNMGNTWQEKLAVGASGSVGLPITFNAYGAGADPIITIMDDLTGWTSSGNWSESTGAEKILNPGFETAGVGGADVFANWIESTAGTSTVNDDESVFHDGSHGCRFDVDAGNSLVYVQTATMVLGASTDYKISLWYYNSAGAKTANFWLFDTAFNVFLKDDGTWNTGQNTIDLANELSWTEYELSFTTHASYTDYKIGLRSNSAAASSIYYDQISLKQVYTNVWNISLANNPYRVLLDSTYYTEAEDVASIDSTNRWFYDSGTTTLHVYATENPSTFYSNMDVRKDWRALDINGEDYITVEDIDIQGGGASLDIRGGSSNIIIDGCTIGKYAKTGVTIVGSDNIVRNSTIDAGIIDESAVTYAVSGGDAVSIDGTGTDANDNLIHDCIIINWGHNGIAITGTDSPNTANGNEVYDCDISAPYSNDCRGVGVVGDTDDICSENRFYRLYIHDTNVHSQINGNENYFYYSIIDTVTQNYLGVSYSNGICLFSSPSTNKSHDNYIYNCIIYNTANHGINITAQAGDWGDVENDFIRNNLIMNWGSGKRGIYITDHANVKGSTYENNSLYKSGVTDVVSYRGTDRTIAEFNGETGNNSDVMTDNIGGDPLMANPAGGDFTLQITSPCINTGVDVSLATDYAGAAVTAPPNIGAYETVRPGGGGGFFMSMGMGMT